LTSLNPPTTVTRRIRRRGERDISRKAIAQEVFSGKNINKINDNGHLYPPLYRDPLFAF